MNQPVTLNQTEHSTDARRENLKTLWQQLNSGVLGAERASSILLIGLLANGHILLEGPPGIGKTALAKRLSESIDGRFRRIQFTPDLLPSDILGYNMLNQKTQEFEFIPGPVFSNIVLADEINRTSPRIQSALLESMNEQQVTIDGKTHHLPDPFMVIATQNNVYSTGTFPLPEPQLDRFLLAIEMSLPDKETQHKILKYHASGDADKNLTPVLHADDILLLQQEVAKLPISDTVCEYIVNICSQTGTHPNIKHQVSARAGIAMMRAAQAHAYLTGNPHVYPDDVKAVAPNALMHRIIPTTRGADLSQLALQVLERTKVP